MDDERIRLPRLIEWEIALILPKPTTKKLLTTLQHCERQIWSALRCARKLLSSLSEKYVGQAFISIFLTVLANQ